MASFAKAHEAICEILNANGVLCHYMCILFARVCGSIACVDAKYR